MKNRQAKNKLVIAIVASLIGVAGADYYYFNFMFNNSDIKTNNTSIINEAPKSDLEVGVEAGLEVGKILLEEAEAKGEKNRLELAQRKPIWVFKFGETLSNKKTVIKEISSISKSLKEKLSVFQKSRNEFLIILKSNETFEEMEKSLVNL